MYCPTIKSNILKRAILNGSVYAKFGKELTLYAVNIKGFTNYY
jgi:hypothetical protein